MRPSRDLGERFWEKVDKSGPCWEWTASKNAKGYGKIQVFREGKHRSTLAHRAAYELTFGPIPEDRHIDHICHNPGCVNPGHLRPVTVKQNLENLSGPFDTSMSGIRGVSWDKASRRWRAAITHNGRSVHVGMFSDINDAEVAVVARRLELFTHNEIDKAA